VNSNIAENGIPTKRRKLFQVKMAKKDFKIGKKKGQKDNRLGKKGCCYVLILLFLRIPTPFL
jgi:hypothetical protein